MTSPSLDSSLSRICLIGRVGNVLSRLGLWLTALALLAVTLLLSRPDLLAPGTINVDLGFLRYNQDTQSLHAAARYTLIGITLLSGAMTSFGFFLAGRVFEFLQRGEVFHAGLGQALRRLGLWSLIFGALGGGFTLVLAGLLLLALGSAFMLAARATEENALTI